MIRADAQATWDDLPSTVNGLTRMANQASTDSSDLSFRCPATSHGSAPDRISGLGVHMVWLCILTTPCEQLRCISLWQHYDIVVSCVSVLSAHYVRSGFFGEHTKLSKPRTNFSSTSLALISHLHRSSFLKKYCLERSISPGNRRSSQTRFKSILCMSMAGRVCPLSLST